MTVHDLTTVGRPLIGSSVRRKEDPLLLRGARPYVADLRRGDELHATVVRSTTEAHARIAQIDTTRARRAEGVVAVLTAADLPQPVPTIPMRLWPLEGIERALQPVLTIDRVRYVGEPVALVVARSRYLAEDAAELVDVVYEPLAPVTTFASATDPAAPELHDGIARNLAGTVSLGIGRARERIESAAHVAQGEFSIQRHSAVTLETRGLIAEFSAETGEITVWGPTKVTHFNRAVLADLLAFDPADVHLVEPSVGGGFGVRGEFYPEDYLIPYAAILLGSRVAWQEDRSENLLAANHSREQQYDARFGFDAEGHITGFQATASTSMGAYIRTHGATVPAMTAIMLPGPYRIRDYWCDMDCVLDNKTPTGTYRAPGRFEGTFVRERLLDMAARGLGLDPAEIRRRNLIRNDELPFDCGIDLDMGDLHVHQVYDSGDYVRHFDQALDTVDYRGLQAQRNQARSEGRCVGVGLACFVEKSGIGNWEYARVEIAPGTGDVTVFTGIEHVGQGIETSMSQIAADALGVPFDSISVVHGDTALVPKGLGAFASRGTMMGGAAVHRAAQDVRRAAADMAARELGVGVDALEFDGVAFRAAGAEVQLGELAARAEDTPVEGVGMRSGICAEVIHESDQLAYPYGTHVTMVEVDRGTGALAILRYFIAYEIGRAINPLLVRGQLVGGFAQGLGGALYEGFGYGDDGRPTFAGFSEYLLPTAPDIPDLEIQLTQDYPAPGNPLGVKGTGEGGTVAVAAALANAVSDALGVEVTELPLSPPAVLALIERAAGRGSGRAGRRWGVVKPAAFAYVRPPSLAEAVGHLGEHGSDARVLAGGQSLVPLMNARLERPAAVVDINGLPSLRHATPADGRLRIGALVRHADLARSRLDVGGPLGALLPLMAGHVGHEAIRSRGTFCGSVAHADPASEWATLAVALDAEMVVVSRRGERRVAATDFFRGPFSTALEPDEILTEVRVPLPAAHSGFGFHEVTRRARDFALAMALVVVTCGGDGRIERVNIALGGVGATPVRATASERALVGASLDDGSACDDAAHAAADGLDPPSDVHADADYRRRVVPALVRRALDDARGRARRNGSS